MVFLSADSGGRYSARDIASHLSVSESHLAKILQRLAKAGFVKSVRGPKGGFTLSARGKDLTLLEIYENIEGPMGCHDCVLSTSLCVGEDCIFGDMLVKAHNLTRKYLAETRLRDIKTTFRKRDGKNETKDSKDR
jgi:Rrf2 family protein